MMNGTRTGIALLILSHGLVGCGGHGLPSAPSPPAGPPVQQTSPQADPIRPVRPTTAAVAPHEGSTHGGAWAIITGADFERGATVRLGDGVVSSAVIDSATIVF